MTERNRCNCSTYLSLLHIMQGPQVNLQIDLNPGGVYEIDKNGPTEVFWKEHPSLEKGKPFYSVTLMFRKSRPFDLKFARTTSSNIMSRLKRIIFTYNKEIA